MKRRDFFKRVAAIVGGAALAPLAKLLPDSRLEQRKAITDSVWNRPIPVGSTVNIRMPQQWYAQDLMTAGNEAVEELRREMAKDAAFLAGDKWS